MQTRYWIVTSLLSFGLVEACGADGREPNAPGDDAGALHELLAHDWKIEPSVEAYYCVYETITEDLYIDHFRPLLPPGTHHVVLGYQDPAVPDGFVDADSTQTAPTPDKCTGATFGDVFAFTATVGTQEMKLPEGVAVRIPKGKQLVLGLHVINTGSEELSGRSGIEVSSPDPSSVVDEAEVIAALSTMFTVPPGESTINATCTMVDDTTVFAVLPHMHLTGVHMKTTAGPVGNETTTLLDADYDFDNQRYTILEPMVPLSKGDQINVACDYENPSSNTLTTGESTGKNEMCITFFYRYPALLTDATPVETYDGYVKPRSYCDY